MVLFLCMQFKIISLKEEMNCSVVWEIWLLKWHLEYSWWYLACNTEQKFIQHSFKDFLTVVTKVYFLTSLN